MKRIIAICIIALFFSPLMLLAQQTESGSLTLPDVAEDVRAVENTPVAVPIPDLLPIPIPAAAPPLPKEQPITIPESALSATGPFDARSRQLADEAFGKAMGEAMVGAFLWDGVTAHLSLYRPGSDPSFSIIFSHETQDGFAFHEPGSGFSLRKTSLQGNFRGGKDNAPRWSISAAFTDQFNGLQEQSQDFSGISHRYLSFIPAFRFPLGVFTVYSELEGSSAALSLERGQSTISADVRAQELGIQPTIGIEWAGKVMKFSLEGIYRFYGLINNPSTVAVTDRLVQQGELRIASSFDISPAFQTGASLGIGTNSSLLWYVPFAVWFDAGLGEVLSMSAKGGLESETRSLRELWDLNPYTDIGPVHTADIHWFAGGVINLYPWKAITLSFTADWKASFGGTGRIWPQEAAASGTRGLFIYETRSYNLFNTGIEARHTGQLINTALGLASQWLDKWDKRSQVLYASLEYHDTNNRFGAAGNTRFAFDAAGIDIPVLDMSAYLRLGNGIRLNAEAQDIFMAFRGPQGRMIWDPYLETGFQAGLRLQFTL